MFQNDKHYYTGITSGRRLSTRNQSQSQLNKMIFDIQNDRWDNVNNCEDIRLILMLMFNFLQVFQMEMKLANKSVELTFAQNGLRLRKLRVALLLCFAKLAHIVTQDQIIQVDQYNSMYLKLAMLIPQELITYSITRLDQKDAYDRASEEIREYQELFDQQTTGFSPEKVRRQQPVKLSRLILQKVNKIQ